MTVLWKWNGRGAPRAKQVEDDGRAEKVHHGGQSRGGGNLRHGENFESLLVVEPKFCDDFLESEWMS